MKYAGPQTALVLFLKNPYTVSDGSVVSRWCLQHKGIISFTKGYSPNFV